MRAVVNRHRVRRVAVGVQQWVTFDPEMQSVQVAAEADTDAEDLLDFAALHMFLHQGRVYAVAPEEVPDQAASIAAVFRYWGFSAAGKVRVENQEHFLIADLRKSVLIRKTSLA